MPSESYASLPAVTAIALAAPLLVMLVPRLRFPSVVLGIVVGPSVLAGALLRITDPEERLTNDADTAAAIVTAGLITVLVFPPVALTLLSRAQADERRRAT